MFKSLLKILGMGEESSRDIARKRLKMVIISDRTAVSPEVMKRFRADLIQVLSNYFEIDEHDMNLSLENESDSCALIANIPLRGMRGRVSAT